MTEVRIGLTAPWPFYDADERDAALAPLASGKVNYWTGQEGRLFEREFAEHFGVRHAVALANGTVALDLCWKVLGLPPGSEVVVSPRTFLASVSSIVLAGLKPVFADVDANSGNITPESIARAVSPNTRAILCVHVGGWPCDMPAIMDLASSADLKVVEDCAQSHGSRVGDRLAGSFGHVNAWSFCQDKIMSTGGEGGMLTTNDDALWESAWSFKDHGKSWNAVYNQAHAPGFRWVHESFGTNWRLTESQSAIGRIQLRKLDAWVETRRQNARLLASALKGAPWLRVPFNEEAAFYRLYASVKPEALPPGWSRDRLMAEFNEAGLPCNTGSCSEVYLEKAFDEVFRPANRLTVARELGDTALSFLVHPTLTREQIEAQAEVIRNVISLAR